MNWIKCSEQLPEDNEGWVVIYVQIKTAENSPVFKTLCKAQYISETNSWHGSSYDAKFVTHWLKIQTPED